MCEREDVCVCSGSYFVCFCVCVHERGGVCERERMCACLSSIKVQKTF